MMTLPILLDLFVVVCLAITIGFAIRLNKRLSAVYKSRQDLQNFLNQFSQSMEKADAGIKDLRGIGESVFKTAQDQLKTAETLKADLTFLNERGEEIAQKLDKSIREAREQMKVLEVSGVGNTKPAKPTGSAAASIDSQSKPESANQDSADVVKHLQNIR